MGGIACRAPCEIGDAAGATGSEILKPLAGLDDLADEAFVDPGLVFNVAADHQPYFLAAAQKLTSDGKFNTWHVGGRLSDVKIRWLKMTVQGRDIDGHLDHLLADFDPPDNLVQDARVACGLLLDLGCKDSGGIGQLAKSRYIGMKIEDG